jgi:hypothetical protein
MMQDPKKKEVGEMGKPSLKSKFEAAMQKKFDSDNKKKAPLGSGERFSELQNKAAASYEKKGMSPEKAKEVGAAIAAKVGQKKYGVKKMTKLAVMSKKSM